MMLVDVTLINSYHKPYADSTLNNMKKSELIEYVRMLEHNYNVAVSFNHQQAKNVEKMLEQKWIPVSEPPKEYRDKYGELIPFLVCEKGTEYPFRGLYDGKTWGDGLFSIYPTHWMPLPEPPKECE